MDNQTSMLPEILIDSINDVNHYENSLGVKIILRDVEITPDSDQQVQSTDSDKDVGNEEIEKRNKREDNNKEYQNKENERSQNNETSLNGSEHSKSNHDDKNNKVENFTEQANRTDLSNTFLKHLNYPEPKKGTILKEKLPSAISSQAWRDFYQRKENAKTKKIAET
ncbi:hypothetical protein FQR65_LT05551 [Abscondita terminalis]|nr:hypothetical protein FQR65_LT05551 [Abscondita terminalis]